MWVILITAADAPTVVITAPFVILNGNRAI